MSSCGAPHFDDHFDIRWGQNDIDRVLKQITTYFRIIVIRLSGARLVVLDMK